MKFTVFTASGGMREFEEGSQYRVGDGNGVLYIVDGSNGQVIAYGPNGWASIQEWVGERQGGHATGGRRRKGGADHADAPGESVPEAE